MRCKHNDGGYIYYYLSVNEDGWKCVNCGKKFGYRPDLDRDLTDIKVGGVLNDMHELGLIYVSNGTMGERITSGVSWRCGQVGMFDQQTIARFILEDPHLIDHGEYWQIQAIEHMRPKLKKSTGTPLFNQPTGSE